MITKFELAFVTAVLSALTTAPTLVEAQAPYLTVRDCQPGEISDGVCSWGRWYICRVRVQRNCQKKIFGCVYSGFPCSRKK
jgi:hypothetical protein